MAFILFVGAAHSGKIRLAQAWAEAAASERVMIATCHGRGGDRASRAAYGQLAERSWVCLDEPLDPLAAIGRHCQQVGDFNGSFVLNSLGMWIRNLMSQNLSPDEISRRLMQFADTVAAPEYSCAVVSEENCSGFMPQDNIVRKYAEILGDANQALAQRAHAVILVACGLPLALKGAVPAVLGRFNGLLSN